MKDKILDSLKLFIERNTEMCEINQFHYQNFNFITDKKDEVEKIIKSYLNNNNINLVEIDVSNEVNINTNLLELANDLEQKSAILYLKNYTETEMRIRYRFSSIYKDACATNSFGVVEKCDIKYLGTIIISPYNPKIKLDPSERSCFGHFQL